MYTKLALLIDGEWIEETNSGSETVLNPATERPLGTLPHAGRAELDHALAAASRAFESWKRTSPYERGQILRRAADLMRERLDHIATVLTLEEGKTLGRQRERSPPRRNSLTGSQKRGGAAMAASYRRACPICARRSHRSRLALSLASRRGTSRQ